MKITRRLLTTVIVITLTVIAGLYLTGNGFILNAIKRTYFAGHITANINDYTEFDSTIIKTATPSPLPKHARYNHTPLSDDAIAELNKYNTAAYLVIKDGQIITEHYLNGYNERSKTNSFSMAKTVTAMLLGIAINEGHIESLDQSIIDFIPEFSGDPLGRKATIGQFAKMNSGYDWDENYYSPFSPTVELLHGDNVTDFLLNRHFSAEPGTRWQYASASTQIMGIFLLRALKEAGAANSLSDYLSRKLWQPLKMNDDAIWHTDGQGTELVYCCLSTNARNFAKLGLLMLNNGNWNGQQLIPKDYVDQMTKPVGSNSYGLSTWLSYDKEPHFFWFSGHLGQYVINIPEHNMVVVRLGEKNDPNLDYRVEGSIPNYLRKHYLPSAFNATQ